MPCSILFARQSLDKLEKQLPNYDAIVLKYIWHYFEWRQLQLRRESRMLKHNWKNKSKIVCDITQTFNSSKEQVNIQIPC